MSDDSVSLSEYCHSVLAWLDRVEGEAMQRRIAAMTNPDGTMTFRRPESTKEESA